MKPDTESLWAAGRALMKDSVGAQGITNTRLQHTHTHARTLATPANTPTHTKWTITLSLLAAAAGADGNWSGRRDEQQG